MFEPFRLDFGFQHEGFDLVSQPTNHVEHSVDFHPASVSSPSYRRFAHTYLSGKLAPGHSPTLTLGVDLPV